jgi:cation diffusion facilitator CzcD-associated flavoprotein CzcO
MPAAALESKGVLPVLIAGGGPAGLATAASLARRGIAYRLLERGDRLGYTWSNAYDSLTLHTGKHLSVLPGLRFRSRTPLFPTKDDFLRYLDEYARLHRVKVETGREVQRVTRDADSWVADCNGERIRATNLVMATGIMANPRVPEIPARDRFGGRVLHSVEYRRPAEFVGHRVLMIGVGNSGGEIASELAHAGAQVTVAVRTGANVVPRQIAGIPTQYLVFALRRLPRRARLFIAARVQEMSEKKRGKPVLPRLPYSPLDAVPLIGFHLVDAIREGLISVKLAGIREFTPSGVRFADGSEQPFDAVIFATGFAPALDPLGDLVRRDAKGFALRSDRVASADQPGLYFVGHNYDSTGGLANIRTDALDVAARIARAR